MRERFRNCELCGRLAATMAGPFCCDRCAELARAGYRSPAQPAAALRPPSTTYDARLIVSGGVPAELPEGFAQIGSVGSDPARGALVRVGADTREELDAAVAELVEAVGEAHVEPYTIQRFTTGGLSRSSHNSNGGS